MKNETFIECLYPNKCAGCGETIPGDKTLCDYCAVFINNLDYKNICTKCGLKKDFCRCKYKEYHFMGVVGVYKNEGIARKAYYSYKFGRREELAKFFAKKTADIVKRFYGNIKFDALVSVPTGFRSRFKRGFDHDRLVAVRLAEILNIKYANDVLKSRLFRPLQHNSSLKLRLENVRGKYYTVKRLNADRVLLFDDIYTSGATLDECAKELLFAGVKEVFCVCVLTTNPKKKPDGDKKNGN